MYACGPTVYDEPHIGHARSGYIFEVIRRYLIYKGYKVKFVRNVTDVDDKIIEKARNEHKGEDLNVACKKVADRYLASYHDAMKSLGIPADKPDIIEPKASEYIGKMIEFIKNLINKDKAYVSGGDVYFDITKVKKYGKLSNQSLDKMQAGARVSASENKKNPLDFTLWKSAKENEPSWPSPWGEGRPGWHIECSVMSSDLLGDEFDIHGGGIDLIFPHHENEIAQSEGVGKKFARNWIHHGLLTINGQKMAKSLENFVTIREVFDKKYPADILKIFYLQAHYSNPIDFSWEKMEEVKKAYERIDILMRKLDREFGGRDLSEVGTVGAGAFGHFRDKFIEYMNDDFNTPRALSVLFDLVSECNKEVDGQSDMRKPNLHYAMDIMKEMADIFGLTFLRGTSSELSDDEVELRISMRKALKKAGNYKEADKIRKNLGEKGIILEDTKNGETTWRRKL